MTPPEPDVDDLDAKLAGPRMIVTTLFAGWCLFAGAAVFSTLQLTGPILPDPLVAYLFLGLAGCGLVAYFVAVPVIEKQQRAAAGPTVAAYTAATFVRVAVLEGMATLMVFGFLATANWPVLAAAGVFAALLILAIPARPRFEAWAARVS